LRKINDRSILAFLIFGILFYWGASIGLTRRQAAVNAITQTGIPEGYRYFFEFMNRTEGVSAGRWRRPLLDATDLKPDGTFFLVSPKRPLSSHEAKALTDWVRNGGRLVLTFRDEPAAKRLRDWLEDNHLHLPEIEEMPGFTNGAATEVEGTGGSRFTAKGEKYWFYSYLGFKDSLCDSNPENCYIREISLGRGQIVAMAGVPPFANGMIERADNAKLAARLAYWSRASVFDEFHQFLTEKSLGDMASEPKILLPLVGFLIMTMFYLFFGSGDLTAKEFRKPRPRPLTTYHALGTEVLRRAVSSDGGGMRDAADWHAGAICHLMPAEAGSVGEITGKMDADGGRTAALNLIRFHKNWLTLRGKK
jgi:hypothetical protein